jgi:predicted Ser/Thr protein kinase
MNESEPNQNMEQKCPQCGAPLPSGVLAGLCPACLFKQGAAADTAVAPDAAPFQPPGVEEIGRLFPQLEIIALIGKGGMGAIYKARQPGLDRIVALKILPPQTAGGPGFVERFNREARALARLNHPNIVTVYEFGQVNGLPFFVMEFVDGLNLRELERAGKLSPREALQIVPQICEALQFAHDEGIVHRDIKPENILLDKKGRVKIADFGIAKILGNTTEVDLTGTQNAIGTPHYMAPEQMEKPTTVDHRADIFSLGVVFYEMLTGELPLGKFSPPSSRKVEVDVRLDDVVLRALEKDPERRYQHASQVKTAVDTIAGSAAPPPGANGAALAQEILAREFNLSIRSCMRRGWILLKGEFWPFVGVTALLIALLGFATSIGGASFRHGPAGANSTEITSAFAMLVWGPLVGGLLLYFLKKIRREPATVETAFCGFSSQRFLHLFLAGFVTSLLTWLGFVCLILPGIYLLVAWMFTLPLVMDKHLDFWSAMELSRKVVTKHWFKFLGLGIVLMLLEFAGVLALCVGVFVMAPLILATLMYAYEDIFGGATPAVATPPAGTGPSGTVVMPGTPPRLPRPQGETWTLATKIGLAAVVLVIAVFAASLIYHSVCVRRERVAGPGPAAPAAPVAPAASAGKSTRFIFGPVIERVVQAQANGTNQFLNLTTEELLTSPSQIVEALAGGDVGRDWEALDIPKDSRRYQYVSWLRESGADLMFAGDGKIIGFDGVFAAVHGDSSTNWDDWDSLTTGQVHAAVDMIDWELHATKASAHGQPVPPSPPTGGSYRSAMQLDSREYGGPVVSLLTLDQSKNWSFKTRDGQIGILQIAGFTDNPPAVEIRYKLVQHTSLDDTKSFSLASDDASGMTRDALNERLDAASVIDNVAAKDKALGTLATNAASAGELEIVKDSLRQISNSALRDQAAHESAGLLAAQGLRSQALEIAKTIENDSARDQALSELAR